MQQVTLTMTNTGLETIQGAVERVRFQAADTGYCVLTVRCPDREDEVAIVGTAPTLTNEVSVRAHGKWTKHPKFGDQFRAESIEVIQPSTAGGIEKYLSSGLIRGIGAEFAKTLVKHFGEHTLEVIEKAPEKLKQVPGIGPKRIKALVAAMAEHKAVQEILVFLHAHGLGPKRAMKVYQAYGDEAVERIKSNPYRLCVDIDGVGFSTADSMAQNLGIPHDSEERAVAGVHHLLGEAAGLEGHCALSREELLARAQKLLSVGRRTAELGLAKAVERNLAVLEATDEETLVWTPRLLRAEKSVVYHLKRLLKGTCPLGKLDVDKHIAAYQSDAGIELADGQRAAIAMGLREKVLVITGGPGVGKSTVVRGLFDAFDAAALRSVPAAPTGRAAKRLNETTGREGKTVHRLLGAGAMGFKHNEENPLEIDAVVVDEVSMVDLPLMASLLKALPDEAILILVGDRDQLPSVGPGSVLRDLIASKEVPVAELTEIFRQAQGSKIIVNSHRMNAGEMPILHQKGEKSDFYFYALAEQDDKEAFFTQMAEKLIRLVAERIPDRFHYDPIRDIQVLTPMHGGTLGTKALNAQLQAALNPPDGRPTLKHKESVYTVGDKVLQLSNDYDRDVFNGDIGYVTEILGGKGLRVQFEGQTRAVDYERTHLDDLTHCYAMSIHKSQGSEFPVVILVVTTQHYVMLERQTYYTGLTRAKELAIVFGQERALKRVVKTTRSKHRVTGLARRLAA